MQAVPGELCLTSRQMDIAISLPHPVMADMLPENYEQLMTREKRGYKIQTRVTRGFPSARLMVFISMLIPTALWTSLLQKQCGMEHQCWLPKFTSATHPSQID